MLLWGVEALCLAEIFNVAMGCGSSVLGRGIQCCYGVWKLCARPRYSMLLWGVEALC